MSTDEEDFAYDPTPVLTPQRASKIEADLRSSMSSSQHGTSTSAAAAAQDPGGASIAFGSGGKHHRRVQSERPDAISRPSLATAANRRQSVSVNDLAARESALTAAGAFGITPVGAANYTGVHCRRGLRKLLKKERGLKRFNYQPTPASSLTAADDADLAALSEDSPLMGGGALRSTKSEDSAGGVSHHEFDDVGVLKEMITGKSINILLFFIPLAVASHHLGWSPVAVFWLNFMAMVPLASLLGDFTEEVAEHTNQVIGGLVNATFGNAVEVVVAIQALLAGEIRIVQASMIGSIFSNLLLVLGGCFFVGGLYYKEQAFNSTAATANMSLLALSSMALVLPTPFGEYYDIEEHEVLAVSRTAACFLMFMYLQLLVFQLRTHTHLFDEEDEAEPEMHFSTATSGLVVVTIIIAILSEYLVGSIDGFCTESGVSRTFVGLIILPVVGNAVEHVTAVTVAAKDKMDLAMGVAVGSCTQISLFVMPLTVIVGWCTGIDMTLNFPHFEIFLFILSVVIVSICVSNPMSNWLEGSLLMTTYLMIATGFWFEKVVDF